GCSGNDPLASPEAVQRMARHWRASLVELGRVGHLNPASGFGDWPQADELIRMLDS
ncbi:alpha/beta hydrolase, partial [Pseudomonas sp. Pseusp97]|uniref:alpha/beta hydrolase n=1 Tax=Pseudomonas sp. Pseusp97 TaxID=3243065 RepID=UPI0039A49EE5